MLLTLDKLRSFTVRAADGDVGRVDDMLFDDQTWGVRYLVVETYDWFFGKLVLISPEALALPRWDAGLLPVALTRAQVESSPPIDLDKPVSRQQVVELHAHYGWSDYYRSGQGFAPLPASDVLPTGGTPFLGERDLGLEEGPFGAERQGDPHLRSCREVRGYRVLGVDEEIGRVSHVVVGAEPWSVRYFLVSAGGWLAKRDVPLLPASVVRIDAGEREIGVNLTRAQVEGSPAASGADVYQRAYERELHDYYAALS